MDSDLNRSGGGWSLEVNRPYSWAWADTFTADECDRIIELAHFDMTEATTFGGVTDYRRSSVRFLYPSPATGWMFQRITGIVVAVNDQHFGFDLTDLIEGVQLSRYAAPSGHYDWHVDMTHQNLIRKLSLSVQLSDDDEYDGGDLELSTKQSVIAPRNVGAAILFPSWTSHRVTPVTSGVRYSLVCWVTGPPFR